MLLVNVLGISTISGCLHTTGGGGRLDTTGGRLDTVGEQLDTTGE